MAQVIAALVGMPVILNTLQYNPLHASTTSPERLDEIVHNTATFDIVVLTGTGHRAPKYEPGPVTRHKIDDAIILQAGHGTGKYTNK